MASIGETANPTFSDFSQLGYLAAGLILGVGIVIFIVQIAKIVVGHMRG